MKKVIICMKSPKLTNIWRLWSSFNQLAALPHLVNHPSQLQNLLESVNLEDIVNSWSRLFSSVLTHKSVNLFYIYNYCQLENAFFCDFTSSAWKVAAKYSRLRSSSVKVLFSSLNSRTFFQRFTLSNVSFQWSSQVSICHSLHVLWGNVQETFHITKILIKLVVWSNPILEVQ